MKIFPDTIKNLFTKGKVKKGIASNLNTYSEDVDFRLKTVKVESLDNQAQSYEKDIIALQELVETHIKNASLLSSAYIGDRINNACTATDGKIRRGLNQRKFNIENTKSFAVAGLEKLDTDTSNKISEASLLLDQAARQKAEDVANIELTPLLNEYDVATKTAKDTESRINELVHDEYNDKPPLDKSALQNNLIYGVGFIILCFADSIFSYTALQKLLVEALPNYMAMFLSLILGICIAVSAHFSGATVKSQNPFEFRTILFIAASLFLVIVLLRAEGGAAFELTILNASVFALAAFLSYWRHRNATYWKLKATLEKARKTGATLHVSIAKVKHQHQDSHKLSKLASEKEQNSKVQAQKAAFEEKILACDKWLDGLDSVYQGYKQRIMEIKDTALIECRKQANGMQNGKSFFDTLPEFGTTNKNGSEWQLPMFGVLALLVISSCSPPTTTEGLCLVDKTIAYEGYQSPLGVEVYPLFSGIEAGNVKFAAITDQHVQPFWTVSIKSQAYFTRVEAKADSAKVKFKSDFNEAFHALPPPSPYYKKTLLFSAIEQHLVPLSQSNSQVKKCVIISDMLENSDTFNFYRFRENPASIMENFDLILAKLDGEFVHQKTMDLTGVDITIVHSPDKENDLLFYYVLQWWQRYLSSKGARVQTVPSLKNGSLLFAENQTLKF